MSGNDDRICSFCRETGPPDRPLFQGPGLNVCICGDCVAFARRLLLDASGEARGECSFCGRTRLQSRQLVFGPGVHICSECVAFASRRLDGGGPADGAAARGPWRRALARVRSLLSRPRVAIALRPVRALRVPWPALAALRAGLGAGPPRRGAHRLSPR